MYVLPGSTMWRLDSGLMILSLQISVANTMLNYEEQYIINI